MITSGSDANYILYPQIIFKISAVEDDTTEQPYRSVAFSECFSSEFNVLFIKKKKNSIKIGTFLHNGSVYLITFKCIPY